MSTLFCVSREYKKEYTIVILKFNINEYNRCLFSRDRQGVLNKREIVSNYFQTKSFYIFLAIEGWTIFVRYIHEEATEDEVMDTFSEHGIIRNIQLNLDRRTGFVKVNIIYFNKIKKILYKLNCFLGVCNH